MRFAYAVTFLSSLMAGVVCAQQFTAREELGMSLFSDQNLSKNRTMSCASCHDPNAGHVDLRMGDELNSVSLGDDGASLGDRNAPTAGYASFSPPFHQREDGVWVGGQFWDGRANTLADQAAGPPLNPSEMGMPDKAAVVARLKENNAYIEAFKLLYDVVPEDVEGTYAAMTQAIAAFEQTDDFSPFDSRYDRALRGEITLTDEEELGRVLFFSQQFTNCNQCHQLASAPLDQRETFTNYEYHNIGVPENTRVRALNKVTAVDHGLLANPLVDDPTQDGKFKVSTLRNVALTGPYMHNGVFSDLRTVVLFYNKYNSVSPARQINPETGEPWRSPEVPQTIAADILTDAPALDDQRVDALVAFMRALTDERYEHLLE